MEKCQHHDEYIKLVEKVESEMKTCVKEVRKEMSEELGKVNETREKDREDFLETRSFVKQLFGRVDNLVTVMEKVYTVENETKNNTKFIEFMRSIGYSVAKWIIMTIIIGAVYALGKGGI